MPYFEDGVVTDNLHATRAVQIYFVRQDTLAAQSLPQWYDVNNGNIGALYTVLKTASTINGNVSFPSTAQVEGWWRQPGADGVFIQVWDSSFATVNQNDQIPVNVL